MKTASETITFRLGQELIRKLDKLRDPFGDSRGQYVQRLAIAHLLDDRDQILDSQLTEIRQSIGRIDDELDAQNERVQRSIRRLAFALLTSIEPLPVEQAKQIAMNIATNAEK